MKIFVFGSSILSSYWNGAATYYRGCYKYLARLGYDIVFAEPDAYGRQQHLDEGDFSYVQSLIYRPATDIDRVLELASSADIVVKHSGLGVDDRTLEARILELEKDGSVIFWDVDAPATLTSIHANPDDPLRQQIKQYDAVITYGGGPWCRQEYLALGARTYFSIYNALDPETHFRVAPDPAYACDIAFLGNRLPDRETRVEELFLRAAQLAPEAAFLLGGEGWNDKPLPSNVRYIGHVPTADHNRINSSAGMVMNINRESMAQAGFSPPTRVFEVAGAGACLLCDDWPGVDDCFTPGKELLIMRSAEDVLAHLHQYDNDARKQIGEALHKRALRDHTYAQRALQIEDAFRTCLSQKAVQGEPASL